MKNLRSLVKFAKKHGWTVTTTTKGHILFVGPNGERVVSSGTASDHRAILNLIAQLRRAGLPVPH